MGKQVATLLEQYLDRCPDIEDRLIQSIGAPAATSSCPTPDDIKDLKNKVVSHFGVGHVSDPGLTELNTPIFEGWATAGGDPDPPVIDWLRDGAPSGVTQEIPRAGIFPESHAPPDEQFDLSYHSPDSRNYLSMDECPEGESIIKGLEEHR